MMHPPETDLALFAGGDLSWVAQWRAERHVSRCSSCQQIVSEYSDFRNAPNATTDPLPELNWTRLASEMKANIRLGLEAGECVGVRPVPRPMVSGTRLAIAGGLLTVLVAIGAWMNRPDLRPVGWQRSFSGTVLEAAESGIQVRGNQQTLRILNPAPRNVIYTVGSQGELRARSLDPGTGNVAITHVYGE